MNEAVLLAALGIVSACVGALVWIIKFMFEKILPALENNNKLTASGIELTKANTLATKSADQYLRERNGRDNEHHTAVLESINAIPTTMQTIANAQSKAILEAVKNGHHIKKQIVDKQEVGKSTVKSETVQTKK